MKGAMTGYGALLKLQLLSRLADYKPRNLFRRQEAAPDAAAPEKGRGLLSGRSGRKNGKWQVFLYIFLFIYLSAFLVVMENLILNSLISLQIPDLLLTLAVCSAMLSTLILSFFFILSSLYFGRDAAFIASLPVTPRTVLAAKLTQVWISETAISAMFILPAAILYAIRVGADALFFPRVLLVWLGVSVLPIVIISFLSTLLIRLSSLWKHRETVATVGGIALMVLYFIFCFSMGNITGGAAEDGSAMLTAFFTNYSTRIESISRYFPPAGWAAKGLCGDWGQLALFLAVCAAAAVFTVWAIGFFYRKLSLLQSETPAAARKGRAKAASFSGASQLKACVVREIRQILRVPSYATNALPSAFMPVLMTGFMGFSMSRAFSQEGSSLSDMLGGLGGGTVLAILAAVMAFMTGINPALATAVSREGKAHLFLTALPVSSRTLVRAKMIVGFGLSVIGCAASAILVTVLLPDSAVPALLALLLALLFSYASGAISLIHDVKHPKLDWITEQEAIKQNLGALLGMLISWGILVALGVASYFLLSWGVSMTAYFACMAAALLLLAVFSRDRLLKAADAYYSQE